MKIQKQNENKTIKLTKEQVLFTRSAPKVLMLYFSKALIKKNFSISAEKQKKSQFYIVTNKNEELQDILVETFFYMNSKENSIKIIMQYYWSKKIIFISDDERIEFTDKSIYEDVKLFIQFCEDQLKKETGTMFLFLLYI